MHWNRTICCGKLRLRYKLFDKIKVPCWAKGVNVTKNDDYDLNDDLPFNTLIFGCFSVVTLCNDRKKPKIKLNTEIKSLVSSSYNMSSRSWLVKDLLSVHVCTEFSADMIYMDGPVYNECKHRVNIASLYSTINLHCQAVGKRDIIVGSRGENSFSYSTSALGTTRAFGHEVLNSIKLSALFSISYPLRI